MYLLILLFLLYYIHILYNLQMYAKSIYVQPTVTLRVWLKATITLCQVRAIIISTYIL